MRETTWKLGSVAMVAGLFGAILAAGALGPGAFLLDVSPGPGSAQATLSGAGGANGASGHGAPSSHQGGGIAPPVTGTPTAHGAATHAVTAMTFTSSVVTTMANTYWDLYEPAIAVAPDDGTIYVTGHTVAADTLRNAAAVSRDHGRTWHQLPSVGSTSLPLAEGVGQGNEGVMAADGAGHAWLYDPAWIAGSAMLYSYCGHGTEQCGIDPLAWDPVQAAQASCGPHLIDRPWVVSAHGKLLLVNNGLYNLTGPARGGFLQGPPAALEVAVYDPATGAKDWEMCAGEGGLPGMPAMRDSDGMIAAPQVYGIFDNDIRLSVMTGPDPHHLHELRLMPTDTDWVPCQAFNGHTSFSKAGTLFAVAAINATTLGIAASSDLEHVSLATLDVGAGKDVRYMWVSGSERGDGALVTWAVDSGDCLTATFYAAHADLVGGQVQLSDISVVAQDVATLCGHYYGNALGPDGKAYLSILAAPHGGNGCGPLPGALTDFPLTTTPLKVYIQDSGPTR